MSGAAKPGRLEVTDIAQGHHRLEAVSMSEGLTIDPTPARVEFKVEYSPDDLLRGQVDILLHGDDIAREEAVRRLCKYPARALVELRNARAAAEDGAARWWLDAAIQEVGRAKTRPW